MKKKHIFSNSPPDMKLGGPNFRNTPVIIARFENDLKYSYITPINFHIEDKKNTASLDEVLMETGFPRKKILHIVKNIKKSFKSDKIIQSDFSINEKDIVYSFESVMIPEISGKGGEKTVLLIIIDITERAVLINRLIESEKLFRSIIDTTPNSIAILDLEYVFEMANRQTLILYGAENSKEILGKNAVEFLDVSYHALFAHNANRALIHGNVKNNLYKMYRIDGTDFIAEQSMAVLLNEINDPYGYIIITRDVTEQKKSEEQIKKLNISIINLQEGERQKIAKDLHDSVSQTILSAKMAIESYNKDPELYIDNLDLGISLLDKAKEELKEIYTGLYPSVLRDLGLTSAIGWHAKNTLENKNIKVKYDFTKEMNLPHNLEVNLYRMVQEIFSNITKHSFCDEVDIDLIFENGIINLLVSDNGVGFDYSKILHNKDGQGISNIKSRVENFDGDFEIKSKIGEGTSITIKIKV